MANDWARAGDVVGSRSNVATHVASKWTTRQKPGRVFALHHSVSYMMQPG